MKKVDNNFELKDRAIWREIQKAHKVYKVNKFNKNRKQKDK